MRPEDVGLDHHAWRPHQEETTEWVLRQKGPVFLEMPTGSGKTAIATALGSKGSVIALMQTKMLQEANYGDTYGWDVLFGRGNYPCAMMGARVTGDECAFPQDMHTCPASGHCEYLQMKEMAKGSSRAALNYAYYMSARWPRQQGSTYLVMDECDTLPETILEKAGTTVTDKQRMQFDLPAFPSIHSDATVGLGPDPVPLSMRWLSQAIGTLKRNLGSLSDAAPGSNESHSSLRMQRLLNKLQATFQAMEDEPADWFIRSGAAARSFNTQNQPGFVARPLTARHHAHLWIAEAEKMNLMMSATIGEPATLAAELGTADYSHMAVPSVWPTESRYIWAPKNAPAIGMKATEIDYVRQAEMMADAIHGCPPEWSGVALMTRKSEAPLVAHRLAKFDLGDRVWVPPQTSTNEQSRLWEERKRKVPGSIMLSWAHWRGWDGLDEKMLFILKTPYPSTASEYERTRQHYDGKMYFWRTGNTLSQGLGRTRRGRPEDYDTDKACNGIVSILDSNWKRVQKYVPTYLRESIIS